MFFLVLIGTGAFILVEMVLLNVMDDRHRDEIANTHLPPQKETDLGAADIVLDELLDDIDIVLPRL